MVPYYSVVSYDTATTTGTAVVTIINDTTCSTTASTVISWGSVWRHEAVDKFIKSRDALLALWWGLRAAQFKATGYLRRPFIAKPPSYGSVERHLEYIRRRHQRL